MKKAAIVFIVTALIVSAVGCGQSDKDLSAGGPEISTAEELGFFEEEVYFEKTIETDVYAM